MSFYKHIIFWLRTLMIKCSYIVLKANPPRWRERPARAFTFYIEIDWKFSSARNYANHDHTVSQIDLN